MAATSERASAQSFGGVAKRAGAGLFWVRSTPRPCPFFSFMVPRDRNGRRAPQLVCRKSFLINFGIQAARMCLRRPLGAPLELGIDRRSPIGLRAAIVSGMRSQSRLDPACILGPDGPTPKWILSPRPCPYCAQSRGLYQRLRRRGVRPRVSVQMLAN